LHNSVTLDMEGRGLRSDVFEDWAQFFNKKRRNRQMWGRGMHRDEDQKLLSCFLLQ
jgi:hypothetical protein